jgi:HEAT repeat protein
MRMLADSGSDEAISALVDIAEKARGENRAQALEMLAQVRPADPAVNQLLIDAVFSGRPNEAHQAVYTLARLGTEESREALITALTGDDEQLASAVAGSISQAGMTRPIRDALAEAARSGKPSVKAQALTQLISAGTEEGIQLAEAALGGDDPEVARQVAYSLGQVGSAQSRALLQRAIAAKDPGVRAAAVSALASSGDDRAIDTVVGLLRDSDTQVRYSAVSALGSMGSGKAVDALIGVSHSGTVEDRTAAAQALASSGDSRAEAALARLITDSDVNVAQTAIYASYNGGEEVDRALRTLLANASADQSLRVAAASQLRSRGADMDDATEKAVEKLLGSPDMGYGGYGYGRYIDHHYYH